MKAMATLTPGAPLGSVGLQMWPEMWPAASLSGLTFPDVVFHISHR